MTRNFRNAYLIVLSLIALLTIVSQVFIQVALANSFSDARVINIAGRQRMLSQRISKAALTIEYLPRMERQRRLSEMITATQEWQIAHIALQEGDATLGLPGSNSPEVKALFSELQPAFNAIRNAAFCLVEVESSAALDDTCTTTDPTTYIDIILENEPVFLTLMNRITFQYDAESTTRVQQLQVIELALMFITLVVLTLEGVLIFRPVVHRLEGTLDQLQQAQASLQHANEQLEHRVRQRTAELEFANQQLENANTEIQDYAHAVSHDLRSPIASIRGFLHEVRLDFNMLRAHPAVTAAPAVQVTLNESLEESINAIEQANERMDRLTRNILHIARAGERELHQETVSADTMVENLLNGFAPQIRQKGIETTVEDLPPIYTDALALEQIFTNLISNAIKYTAVDRTGCIRVYGWTEGDHVIYAVEDNGRGIAPNEHGKIFQLFQRAGVINVEGDGMGLYYVRRLLARLHGSIWFESQVSQGSTFYVRLPKNPVAEKVLA